MGKVFTFVMLLLSPITSPTLLSQLFSQAEFGSFLLRIMQCRYGGLSRDAPLREGECLLYCMIASPSAHPHMFSSSLFVPGGSSRLFRLRSSFKASLPDHPIYVLDDEPTAIGRASVVSIQVWWLCVYPVFCYHIRFSGLLYCQDQRLATLSVISPPPPQ